MTRLVSPYGAVVDVSEEKAARLGWERLEEPAQKAEQPAKRAPAKKAAPAKRTPAGK